MVKRKPVLRFRSRLAQASHYARTLRVGGINEQQSRFTVSWRVFTVELMPVEGRMRLIEKETAKVTLDMHEIDTETIRQFVRWKGINMNEIREMIEIIEVLPKAL